MTEKRFWLAQVTHAERVTWAASFGGRVFDAMDSQIYALVLPTLIGVFALSRGEAGVLGSLTTFVAAFSTLFAGSAIDRFGRLRVLQGAIAISAVSTLLASFAHSLPYLAVMRAIQGIGYAAELTASMTLVNETINPRFRATAVSWVQSGYAVGYTLALLGTLAIFSFADAKDAWRFSFGLGLIPAVYVLVLQRYVRESPLFLAQRREAVASERPTRFTDLFRGANRRNVLITASISVGVYGASQVLIFWLPTYLHTAFHLNVTKTAGYMALNIAGGFIGSLVYGPASDRIGRRPVFLGCLFAQAIAIALYIGFVQSILITLALGFVVGLLQGGLASGLPPIIAELFGTRIRGRAVGFNNAVVRAAAALTPALVGFLSTRISFGLAIAVVVLCLYALAILGVFLVSETRGVSLTADGLKPAPEQPARVVEHGTVYRRAAR